MTARVVAAIAAALFLNVLLVLPDRLLALNAASFTAVAAELVVIVGLLALVPQRAQPFARGLLVAAILLAVMLKLANMAAYLAYDRPADPTLDVALVMPGIDLLTRSYGAVFTALAVIAFIVGLAALAAIVAWSLRAVTPAQRPAWGLALLVVGIGLAFVPSPITSARSARILVDETRIVIDGVKATEAFEEGLAHDPEATVAPPQLLARLKGHDVLLVFVESYGRVTVENPLYAGIAARLDAMSARFADAGISTRSGWITSSTFGGQSWLAHSTVLSGLWINSKRRYDMLTGSTRSTLIGDFKRAGWRAIGGLPEITLDWPEGRYFGYDKVYDAKTLAYKGKRFAYVSMPDQFTLSRIHDAELAVVDRPPVMAEIALVTSHAPWTPVPKVVPWDQVGDGTIFDTAREGESPEEVWSDPQKVRVQYGRAIGYVLELLESFVLNKTHDKTVLIVLGDHQPMTNVSGDDAPREVPIHIIARDPAVLEAVRDWNWTPGMRPTAESPTWKMNDLRGRIVQTFSAGAP